MIVKDKKKLLETTIAKCIGKKRQFPEYGEIRILLQSGKLFDIIIDERYRIEN